MSEPENPSVKFTEENELDARKPVGYFQLIVHNSNFRWFWSGQTISLLGDWFNIIASATLITQLSESGLAVGVLFTIHISAALLVAPVAGIFADRYNRKHFLLITDLVRAFIVFGFLLVQDKSDIWLLYTLTTLLFGISGLSNPARNAILPDITSSRELGTANTLGATSSSVMYALGAALGGVTTGLLGSQTAFVIDGLTFFISVAFLLQIKLPSLSATAGHAPTQKRLESFRYMLQHRDILFIVMHKAVIATLFSSGFQPVQVEIAKNHFTIGVGGALSLGLMYAVSGIGGSFGPILIRRWTADQYNRLRISISIGYLIGVLGLVAVALLLNLPTVLLGGAFRSFGNAIVWFFSTQLLFQHVPNEIRGRIFGVEFALYTLMGGISSFAVGALLDRFHVQTILWGMVGPTLLPIVLWSLWQIHYNRMNRTKHE